ncbi:flagellar hook-associated family protein [Sinorhizobium sp. BG8]|uniref:flagellar hook-associated family protein n=1 Tax=Sinorhizobium sp. BG8 TaxID=2613773 RepID=UPI00193D233A|nr:flagellar hook-associated family protein [Sinorhizobium sp. BG8]QRM54249.1 flagellar hook-associated family protein [Sinorhizobium sp. BG8]
MKTSLVSNLTLQNAMRQTIAQAQKEMLQLEEESVTGRYADVGAVLGAKTARSLNLEMDMQRLESFVSMNALTTSKLAASQGALSQISEAANSAMETNITFDGTESQDQLDQAKESYANALSIFTSAVNTSYAGEYLFAGINTDVMPVSDYLSDPASAAKTAFDQAFVDFFGFTQTDAQTADITSDQMSDFIAELETSYMGTGWDDWSTASDQNMTSRISGSEVIQSSTNANIDGMRKFALGAVIGYELLNLNLSSATRSTVSEASLAYIGEGITGIDAARSTLGVSEARVEQANTSLETQITILTTSISDMVSVDTYEAATRINTLETQLSLAYTLTSKLQDLSLVNYL